MKPYQFIQCNHTVKISLLTSKMVRLIFRKPLKTQPTNLPFYTPLSGSNQGQPQLLQKLIVEVGVQLYLFIDGLQFVVHLLQVNLLLLF